MLNDTPPVLEIDDLTVRYRAGETWQDALRGVSLAVRPGETYGLVGESGSGKSTLAHAVMRYLGKGGQIGGGAIRFEGQDLLRLDARALRKIWGAQISLVPQDPRTALNPAMPVGAQIAEVCIQHDGMSRAEASARAVEMLRRVRIADPEGAARRFPHQLSGGQQQRALIAMAVASRSPRLLILDEPTTSLDVTTESAILDLLIDLQVSHGAAMLYVTHNLGVVARLCDRVAVLYAGNVMEDAPKAELFRAPLHPYTRLLMAAIPRIGADRVQAIPGQIPPLGARPAGCVFAPRCPLAVARCQAERPSLESAAPDHRVACHRWREVAESPVLARAENGLRAVLPDQAAPPLLEAREVSVRYKALRAVKDVSLDVPQGRTLGLVGESGSGKTTFARSVLGLIQVEAGQITLSGLPLRDHPRRRPRDLLRAVQIVFQNPEESLNPYHRVGMALRRPLISLRGLSAREADQRVPDLLRAVSLPPEYAARFPRELSGGEKQRVAIARAFAAEPDLLVCDEPVSALDVSVQAAILNLLRDLGRENGAAYLFISHDLAIVGYLADRIAVIYRGQIVEESQADAFFRPPHHPYTEALLSSIPALDPDQDSRRIRLPDDDGKGWHTPGCPFHPRCPYTLGTLCETTRPPWQGLPHGTRYRCHLAPEDLIGQQTRPTPTEES